MFFTWKRGSGGRFSASHPKTFRGERKQIFTTQIVSRVIKFVEGQDDGLEHIGARRGGIGSGWGEIVVVDVSFFG